MRDRSIALVVRDSKILMLHTFRFNRFIYELPGGGIEAGETPAEAALRELQEECGLEGAINRPLNILHRKNGSKEYVFLVDVLLSEKDRAFLWSYGLMDVDGFFDIVLSWGDSVSYPMQ